MVQVILGQIIHTKSINDFEVIPNGFVAFNDGKIIGFGEDYLSWKQAFKKDLEEIALSSSQFLMPGFIDCHIHAPQIPNIGLGLDKPLLEWLNTYTFPLEAEYKNVDFAQSIYEKVVKGTIKRGTTLAAYFGTNHREGSIILAKEVLRQGQRAFVGKVSSDCNCPDFYVETYEESLKENLNFVKNILDFNSDLVKPIITPRFALSCSKHLMKELGHIADKYDLHIQSHISENCSEVELVKRTFGQKTYANVYNEAGLLRKKCILAHAVHLEDEEIELLRQTSTSVAHCPASNTMLSSGLCDVKRLLKAGIKVGLGTDVSGGNQASIQDAILRTMDVSHHIEFLKKQEIKGVGKISKSLEEPSYIPLNYKEAVYLATLGGAEALCMENKVGNFDCGKDFDALVIDIDVIPIKDFQSPYHAFRKVSATDKILEYVQKFVYVGDDRNIIKVFVKGKQIK